jgi:kinesin family protein 23
MRTPVASRYGMGARTPGPGSTDTSNGSSCIETEEVAVLARVRPLGRDDPEERCIEVMEEGETLQLLCPASSARFFNASKVTQFSFNRVFDEASAQKDVFDAAGLPLVRELIQGRNGLLFTYGVTGSGKTHTMQGTLDDGGVMSRAIDVIFNSLEGRLVARRYMVMPAEHKLNDFQIQTVPDAASMQQKEMLSDLKRNNGGRRFISANSSDPDLSGRLCDDTKAEDLVDRNMVYAVFISYCEIYNKNIFDLLEMERDMAGKPK